MHMRQRRINSWFRVPWLYALGLDAVIVIGGLSAIFRASTPVDAFIHDSYFIVGHIHYVLFGGLAFAVFAGVSYLFMKLLGRMMNQSLGRIHFRSITCSWSSIQCSMTRMTSSI